MSKIGWFVYVFFVACPYFHGVFGSSDAMAEFARFGIPIASSGVNATSNQNDFGVLHQGLLSLPVIKFGLVTSFVTMLIPFLHVLLIGSLMLFALTGTAAFVCQMVDCGSIVGTNHNGGPGSHQYFNSGGFSPHQYSSAMFQRRRKDVGRKPWKTFAPPSPLQAIDDTVDKFEGNN